MELEWVLQMKGRKTQDTMRNWVGPVQIRRNEDEIAMLLGMIDEAMHHMDSLHGMLREQPLPKAPTTLMLSP